MPTRCRSCAGAPLPVALRSLAISFICLAIASALPADARADEILLQRSFWSGWQYAPGDDHFRGIGSLGKTLRAEMRGSPAAQEEMRGYGSGHLRAQILMAASGGLAVGATLYGIDHEDFDATAISMTAGSILLGVIGSAFENSAVNHLLRAVHLHNAATVSGGPGSAVLAGAGQGGLPTSRGGGGTAPGFEARAGLAWAF